MTNQLARQIKADAPAAVPPVSGVLQRKCACGTHTPGGGTCGSCAAQKRGLQRKVIIDIADPLEEEADRVAELTMRSSLVGRPIATPRIQRRQQEGGGFEDEMPASVTRTLNEAGRPMDAALRDDMSRRFGFDFSAVRVHRDDLAAQSARNVDARAYTVGNHIVFGAGEYSSETSAGRRLIAHELTHVVQQGGASVGVGGRLMRRPLDSGNGRNREGQGGPSSSQQPIGEHMGSTLPYREATELAECIRIMGPASAEYCRQEVLGEAPMPCPLSISGPSEVNHLCAAYVPSEEPSCGTFPAPNITLNVQGAQAGVALVWSIASGATRASIAGPANAASVQIRGDGASASRGDVLVSVSNGICSALHAVTVLEPTHLTTAQTQSSGPSFVEDIVEYTVQDQFNNAMGADICLDETMTVCSRSHNIRPEFGDAPTDLSGQTEDHIRAAVATGSLPANLCVKINQSITAGGCGPLINNTLLYRPTGITLTPNSNCAVGDPCP